MKNFIQNGDFVTISVSENVTSGDLVVIQNLVGVACLSSHANEPLTISTVGVYELPKNDADVITVGIKLFADGKKVKLADKGVFVGIAIEEAGAGKSTVKVKLCN